MLRSNSIQWNNPNGVITILLLIVSSQVTFPYSRIPDFSRFRCRFSRCLHLLTGHGKYMPERLPFPTFKFRKIYVTALSFRFRDWTHVYEDYKICIQTTSLSSSICFLFRNRRKLEPHEMYARGTCGNPVVVMYDTMLIQEMVRSYIESYRKGGCHRREIRRTQGSSSYHSEKYRRPSAVVRGAPERFMTAEVPGLNLWTRKFFCW